MVGKSEEDRRRVKAAPSILETCPCLACVDLRSEIGRDPKRWHAYGYQLLVRGWAGTTTEAEKAYRRAHASEPQRQMREKLKNDWMVRFRKQGT